MSLVLGLTGAWFTDHKSAGTGENPLTFGNITIAIDSEGSFNYSGTVESDFLMPGDTIEGNFTVTNAKEACYVRYSYVFDLNEALTGDDATALDAAFTTAGYTVTTSGKTYTIALDEASKISLDSGRADQQVSDPLGGDITVPTTLSDAAEDKTVTITLNVYAVQQDNYPTSGDAAAKAAVWTAAGLTA